MSPVTRSTGASPSASIISLQDLGVAFRGIRAVEHLDPGLKEFARPRRPGLLSSPDRAAIGVARRIRAATHVHLDDGHCEIGPKHHLARIIAGDESPRADVLAVEVEQHRGGLKRGGLDPDGAVRVRTPMIRAISASSRSKPAPTRAPFR